MPPRTDSGGLVAPRNAAVGTRPLRGARLSHLRRKAKGAGLGRPRLVLERAAGDLRWRRRGCRNRLRRSRLLGRICFRHSGSGRNCGRGGLRSRGPHRRGWRRGLGLRSRCGRRHGSRRRGDGTRRRQQSEGVEVLVVAQTYSEMNVRRLMLGLARRPCLGDRIALVHACPLPHEQRSEVRERGSVAALGGDRDSQTVARHGAGEGDLAARGGAHGSGPAEPDVDPAMLTRGVLVVAHREGPQDGAVGRPRPRGSMLGRRQGGADTRAQPEHAGRCPMSEHPAKVATAYPPGNRS